MQPPPTRRHFPLWVAYTAAPILVVTCLLLSSQPASAQPASAQPAFAHSTITVTTPADNLDSNGDCSLREAIESANRDVSVDACAAGDGGDTIMLPAGVYTITLAGASENANQTGDYDVTGSVAIVGAGAENSVIVAADFNNAERKAATYSSSSSFNPWRAWAINSCLRSHSFCVSDT